MCKILLHDQRMFVWNVCEKWRRRRQWHTKNVVLVRWHRPPKYKLFIEFVLFDARKCITQNKRKKSKRQNETKKKQNNRITNELIWNAWVKFVVYFNVLFWLIAQDILCIHTGAPNWYYTELQIHHSYLGSKINWTSQLKYLFDYVENLNLPLLFMTYHFSLFLLLSAYNRNSQPKLQ